MCDRVRHGRRIVVWAGSTIVAACGCAPTYHDLSLIQSPDAGVRILAIRAAGERKDPQAVPLLVDRLEDDDEGVRFFAILALERITGRRLGYEYRHAAAVRAAAVDRWRAYVRDRPRAEEPAPAVGEFSPPEHHGATAGGGEHAAGAARAGGQNGRS